jgi:hypothetical protein
MMNDRYMPLLCEPLDGGFERHSRASAIDYTYSAESMISGRGAWQPFTVIFPAVSDGQVSLHIDMFAVLFGRTLALMMVVCCPVQDARELVPPRLLKTRMTLRSLPSVASVSDSTAPLEYMSCSGGKRVSDCVIDQ